MHTALSPVQISQYERDGVFFPIAVLSADEVARFRGAFEALRAPDGTPQKAVQLPHLHLPWAHDLATHPAVLDAVEGLLGPNILVHASLIFYKPPRDAGFVSWHQDGLYPGMDSPEVVSAWIALSESTVENGCLRVVPGSHKQGIFPHTERAAKANMLRQGQEVQVEVDEDQVVDVTLRAGEMSLHHANIIHGSNPNRSATERMGFIVRYIAPEIQLAAKHPVLLARGRADTFKTNGSYDRRILNLRRDI